MFCHETVSKIGVNTGTQPETEQLPRNDQIEMKRIRNPLDESFESLDFPKTLDEQRRGLRNGVCVGNRVTLLYVQTSTLSPLFHAWATGRNLISTDWGTMIVNGTAESIPLLWSNVHVRLWGHETRSVRIVLLTLLVVFLREQDLSGTHW